MKHKLLRLFALCALVLVAGTVAAQDVTALWDWKNGNPSGIKAATSFQGTTGTIASTVDGITLTVDATSGKLAGRDADAQFNTGTKIQVPVKSTNDVVTVTSYPGYHNYTIGGTAADADAVDHKALTSEVAQGYVEVVATGDSYLYSIQVVQKSMIQEKQLYSTDFSTWTVYNAAADATNEKTVTWTTKYSHETLTFSILNTQISSTNTNSQKFPTWTGGYLIAAKSETPYVMTSTLASITKVHFMHGATGSKRGWKLEAKGDGDTDWVTISNTVATSASGTEVTVNVNRTNCQLRFTNLNTSQNAYLMQLDIYGNVDMSKTPSLGSFVYNGVTYQAADIFEETEAGVQTATIELFNETALPSTDSPLTDITLDNGTLQGDVTYETTTDGVTVSIAITANDQTVTYKPTFVHKPYYTLTYYNTDGTTVLEATQQVEKDKTIATLRDDTGVTVADGQKFRGWFVSASGGRKYTTDDVVTSDLSLYAVATDIEVASTTASYRYTLTDPYFYAEDHEVFGFTGSGAFYNAQHGWSFKNGDKIDVPVGGNAYLIFGLCQYSGGSATIDVTDASGNSVGSVTAKGSTDGKTAAVQYTGDATTLTITFNGGAYLHNLSVTNTQDNPIEKNAAGYYVVKAGDGNHFLTTLAIANANASTERTYIFLPDGTYDLGETVLTPVSGDNISIVGQSMEKTIIKNAPPVSKEGIGTTATLYVTGKNLYLQDLTLQNALDYYASGSAGRAVCLQDKGNHTICKNVRMLSYQDTYYSANNSAQLYWEDSEIHGTVDYLCGGGDVYFNRCKFVNEKRQADGKGACTIAAPYTDGTSWGYVMQGCTIETLAESFNYARAWGGTPRIAYLNTTILEPAKLASSRFTAAGMNVAADKFKEYNTLDADGNVISPASNIMTFTKDKTSNTYETILTADEAAGYALDKVFTTWYPDQLAAQKTMTTIAIDGSELTWEAVDGALAYAVFNGDTFVGITSTNAYTVTEGDAANYKVRAANSMGGFGLADGTTTAIRNAAVTAADADAPAYNLAGQRVGTDYRGIVIRNGKKYIVK